MDVLEQRRHFTAAGVVDATYGSGLGFSGQVTGSMTLPDSATIVRPVVRFAQASTGNKITVAGTWVWRDKNVTGGFVGRYNSNGSRDTSFGNDGLLVLPLGSGSASRQTDFAFTVDSSGRAYIADTSSDTVRVRRIRSSGSLDSAFGNNGVLSISTGGQPVAKALSIAPDGAIFVAADVRDTTPSQKITVAKFTTSGSLSLSFGSSGIATIDPTSRDDSVVVMKVDSTGRPVLGGFTTASSNRTNSMVLRLTTSGVLDRSFNRTGVNGLSVSSNNDRTTDIRVSARGSVLALVRNDSSRSTLASGGANAAMVFYSARGQIESTFGVNGVLNTNATATWTNLRHEAVFRIGPSRSSGGIVEERVVAGEKIYGVSNSGTATLRADSRQRLDAGTTWTDLPAMAVRGSSILLAGGQANGPAGGSPAGGNDIGSQIRAYGYTSTLGRDNSFNASGVNNNLLTFGPAQTNVEVGGTLLLSGVAGDSRITRRFRPNGALDSSLDSDGQSVTNSVYSSNLTNIGTIVRGDGGFWLWSDAARSGSNLIQRYALNGQAAGPSVGMSTKSTFDSLIGGDVVMRSPDQVGNLRLASIINDAGGGASSIPDGDPILGDVFLAQIPGSNGQFYVQGTIADPLDGSITKAVYRIQTGGDLNGGFADNGVLVDFSREILFAQADEKLVHRYDLSGLARLTLQGTPDITFGNNGLAAAGFKDFEVDQLGRILAWKVRNDGAVTLLRLDPDGRPDATFDGDGLMQFNIPGSIATSRTRYDVLIEPDNDIVFTALLDESAGARSVRWSATRIGGGSQVQFLNNQTLMITGSPGSDSISVTLDNNEIVSVVNGQTTRVSSAGVTRVRIDTFGGNDSITIDAGTGIDALIDAGDGNDTLQGGTGNDTLIGGNGQDSINGGTGNDLLLARDNSVDTLVGGGGDDVAEVDRDDDQNVLDQSSGVDVLR